ncbi:metal-binding protein [Tissierella creatinini]|nr:metal-binding protein [Tissierella creatinini]TJX65621.1 metal-binding protein [Soehngenia saccharolytica]
MENSYRFYRNLDCSYFPCHKVENEEEFNCMFCYCPLYFFKDCGGNYKDKFSIKDCSKCLIPHRPKGYDYINDKIRERLREQQKL